MSSLNVFNVTATSSGLTTATTAYSDGDVLGSLLSWNLGTDKGLIISAVLTDVADVIGAADLFLFDRSVTLGTDNSAPSISDADVLFCLGVVQFPYPADLGGTRVSTLDSLSIGFDANASSTIYGGLVTRSAHTFFGAATDLQVRLLGAGDL